MIRRYISAAAIWLVGISLAVAEPLPQAAPEEVGLSSERLARIDSMIEGAIDDGLMPGAVALVARHGRIAYFKAFGMRDEAAGAPMRKDSIFRIYSMTKPFTSVAVMMLVEEGKLKLGDPVSKFLPELAELEVGIETFVAATGEVRYHTAPAERQITVQDLLRHTSGMVYGIFGDTAVHRAYREGGIGAVDVTNQELVERLAEMPLLNQPGTVWEYGRSTDVLGRLVEVVSGKSLGDFFAERITGPLGLEDTAFYVTPNKFTRIAEPLANDKEDLSLEYLDIEAPPEFEAGGQGLVSTAEDYARFCQMLLNGGALEGTRILGPKTVGYMTSDHVGDIDKGPRFLPGPGYGFGLGFGVRTHEGLSSVPGSVGEFYWGGYAGTYFWVDPKEDMFAVYMMQSVSQRAHLRPLFKSLVMQAIVDPAETQTSRLQQ